MTNSKLRHLLAIFAACLMGFSVNEAMGCTGWAFPPPPPDWDGKFHWTKDDVVLQGVVDSVEKNVGLPWVERKLIEWRFLKQPHIAGTITPLHRIKLREVRYFAGSGTVSVTVELSGCGLPIPKPGERALLFSEGTGKERKFNPLYESDGKQFTDSFNQLEKATHSKPPDTN